MWSWDENVRVYILDGLYLLRFGKLFSKDKDEYIRDATKEEMLEVTRIIKERLSSVES